MHNSFLRTCIKFRIIYFCNNHNFFLANKKISNKNNHLQAEESKNISENKMKCNVVDNQCESKKYFHYT